MENKVLKLGGGGDLPKMYMQKYELDSKSK